VSAKGEPGKTRQLFGTDGIRGVAGEFPLNESTVFDIGRALGARLSASTGTRRAARVLIGQDTRESSQWIAEALAAGLRSKQVEAHSAGVVTTPGVAYLARTRGFEAGVVISASHNPWHDNGIKVFGADGYKLSDAVEHEIEREIFQHIAEGSTPPARRQALEVNEALHSSYVEWLAAQVSGTDLGGLKALIDCAHGATSQLAGEVMRAVGVEAVLMNTAPDGRNINDGCGALHPEIVAKAIGEASAFEHYDLGISFDGDGDRALFSDARGRVVNGDGVLLLCARVMLAAGKLRNATVVATTMSNMGLEAALRHSGIQMLRAPVGDKYVLEEMVRSGATLGGEQSGHIIYRDGDSTTGDGLLTALRVMQVMATSGKSLAELVGDLKVFPQTIKNVRVREKRPLDQIAAVASAIKRAELELGEEGRVVVRYSGTEPLARVMVEAADEAKMRASADAIAGVIQRELGAQ